MNQCGDTRWGDWRPHLAMITSNSGTSDINRRGEQSKSEIWLGCHVVVVTRSITTLGDSLLAKGQLFAAQFCYIVSKLVLLLSFAAGAANIEAFATTAAIQCTEIYEFVQRLGNKDYQMPFLHSGMESIL